MRQVWLALAMAAVACGGARAAERGEPPTVLRAVDRVEAKVRPRLVALLAGKGLRYPPCDVFLRVFKREEDVELWARNDPLLPFVLVKVVKALNLPLNYTDRWLSSGWLAGPKRKQGDLRVPEGLYKVLYHNPWSTFYLSLALGYPNPSDAVLGRLSGVLQPAGEKRILEWWAYHGRNVDERLLAGAPPMWYHPDVAPVGNDIFMHGKDVTIGCIPVGDRAIEELFVLTDARRVGGTEIHVFPFRFGDPANKALRARFEEGDPGLKAFWASLEGVWRWFEQRKRLPARVYVDRATGLYRLTPGPGCSPY